MNIYMENTHKKILLNQIQKCIKKLCYHQMRFINLKIQGWFRIQKSLSLIHHINGKTPQKLIVITNNKYKYDKIQHSFMTKALNKHRSKTSVKT